jgi:[ribosomal protein S5]-alanine N-acetyltransferase
VGDTGRVSTVIPFPLLTPRLLIRPMRLSDAAELFAVYGDADLMRHLTPDVPASLEEAEGWVRSKIELFEEAGGLSLWTVQHRKSGRIVGDVGLQQEDYGWDEAVIGLGGRGSREFWHQGLAIEASIACLETGFTDLGLDRIGAETAPGNLPAQRLLERLGMERAGSNADGWPVYLVTRERWESRPAWRPPSATLE